MRGLALPWRGQMKDEVAIWPEDSADRSARMLLCVLTGDGAGAPAARQAGRPRGDHPCVNWSLRYSGEACRRP
jgi:hypothetical protein